MLYIVVAYLKDFICGPKNYIEKHGNLLVAVSFMKQGLYCICQTTFYCHQRTFRQPKPLESGAIENRGTLLSVGKQIKENQNRMFTWFQFWFSFQLKVVFYGS